MRITVEVREEAFRTPKTAEQIAEEVRQGATMLWLARGDVTPEGAREVTAPQAATPGGTSEKAAGFKEFLRSMPDVGDDADFERPLDYGRPVSEWDT